MKRVIVLLLLAVTLVAFITPPAQAQITFILGIGVGALLFGDRGDGIHEVNRNTVYILPRVSERVKDPLAIQFARFNYWQEKHDGMSLYTMFKYVEPNADRYEILEVIRVITPSNQAQAIFWFAYIKKGKVVPFEALPKR